MATVATLRLGPADHGRRMTLEEFYRADAEEGYRYELARGIVEVSDVSDEPHGMIWCELMRWIFDHRREHSKLIALAGGASMFRFWLPGLNSSRTPDIAVVLHGAPREEYGHRIPALVMEIVSEGPEAHECDYVTKREEYLAYGLYEYWIVDRFARTIIVLTRRGDLWSEAHLHRQPGR